MREHRPVSPSGSGKDIICERCRQPLTAIRRGVWLIWLSPGGSLMAMLCRAAERAEIAQRAEELHAEHHRGYIVPDLDSCREHARAEYEHKIKALAAASLS